MVLGPWFWVMGVDVLSCDWWVQIVKLATSFCIYSVKTMSFCICFVVNMFTENIVILSFFRLKVGNISRRVVSQRGGLPLVKGSWEEREIIYIYIESVLSTRIYVWYISVIVRYFT